MRYVPTFGLVLISLCGCSKAPPAPVAAPAITATTEAPVAEPPAGQSEPVLEPGASKEPAATAVAASDELKIDILDWNQTQAIVAEHPGKVVVFDLWATYCPPCLKELPGLIALQEKYPEQVVCVSVCLDYEGDPEIPPAKIEPDIRPTLVKINVLLSTSTDDLFKLIEHQSMPVLYVFDQTGKRVAMFPDLKDPVEPTYAKDIVPVVEKLLAAPANP
jgi:thiol-disulfide isomerase/thioredoxin